MKFNDTFYDIQNKFLDGLKNGATVEEQVENYKALNEALKDEIIAQAEIAQANNVLDQQIVPGFTAKERKFFTNLVDNNKTANPQTTGLGYNDTDLLPEETVERVFDDLVHQHPFLEAIGLRPSMLRTKVILADAKGVAVWGKISDDIKGQLDTAFTSESFEQNKLTAYVVIPQDIIRFGPAWMEKYIRAQMTEAFAYALEDAFINGNGKTQPVGLKMSVKAGEARVDNTFVAKEAEGALTLSDPKMIAKELAAVMAKLSFKEDGKTPRADMGTVKLLVNRCDAYQLRAQFMIQNAVGQWIENIPFGIEILESALAPAGQAIFFLPKWYDAYIGSQMQIEVSDEVKFLEDLRVYKAIMFAYGKARDNNVAVVYTLPEGTHNVGETMTNDKA